MTGGTGFTPPALNAAIAPPPVPSLAATTPTIFEPNRVIWPATQFCAASGFQSGRVVLGEQRDPAVVDAAWMPFLIRPAAASVGEP